MCKSDTMHQQFMDIHFLSIFQYWFFYMLIKIAEKKFVK